MPSDRVLLPGEALARWRALEPVRQVRGEPVQRVIAWFEHLRARMCCSSGRLAELLIATGLVDAAAIAECALAQLDAGPPGEGALRHDVESDLFALPELADAGTLERLSSQLAGTPWARTWSGTDSLHVGLARRLFDLGQEGESAAALERVRWHSNLIRFLQERGGALLPARRQRLVALAGRRLEACHLPAEFHVGPLVDLAVIARDRAWLERARGVIAALPAAELETTPDHAHPLEDLAWGLAELGSFDEAMATIASLAPDDRWCALIRLLPRAPEPATRAAMIDELVRLVAPLDLHWAHLIEEVPEAAPQALRAIDGMADEQARFEELAGVARYLRGERAQGACAWMLAHARAVPPGSSRWESVWQDFLEAAHACGCEALLDAGARRGLLDEILGRPEVDLWHEAAPFVPDDRVIAVLERSCTELAAAEHYIDRERWIEVGLATLDRAPAALAERWRTIAAEAMAGTGIEGAGIERLAAWSPDQRRAIVLARLDQHQRWFLPRQLIQPWIMALGWELPPRLLDGLPAVAAWIDGDVRARQRTSAAERTIEIASDPAEQGRCRAALEERIERSGWPEAESVVEVIALLGRCSGEAAIAAALGALAGDGEPP